MLRGPKGEKRPVLPRTLPSIPLTLSATSFILCASQSAKLRIRCRPVTTREKPGWIAPLVGKKMGRLHIQAARINPTTSAMRPREIILRRYAAIFRFAAEILPERWSVCSS